MAEQWQDVLDHAVAVAQKAGKVGLLENPDYFILLVLSDSTVILIIYQVVREALQSDRKVSTKSSSIDLVTQTDQKVEQLIIQSVKETFPAHR